MPEWRATTRVAAAMLDSRGRPRRGSLPNAAVRAALILDAAAARCILPGGDGIHVSSTAVGFGPADEVLTQLDAHGGDLRAVVGAGSVGIDTVAREFVQRGWWLRQPGPPWRRTVRYRVGELVAADLRDPDVDLLVRMVKALFVSGTDTDDVRDAADRAGHGAGTWAVPLVFHELIERKLWLDAAAAAPRQGVGM